MLMLDLVETAEGIGGQIVVWTTIEPFHKRICNGQYRHVEVFFKGEKVETVDVREVFS